MNKLAWRKLILWVGAAGILLVWYVTMGIYTFAQRVDDGQADAAIVLGAAAWKNRPSPIFRERINHAILLYERGEVQWLIFTGGQGRHSALSEAEVARTYALQKGVSAEHILIETRSTNTIENLSFAHDVAKAQNIDTFFIVSTPWHMKRAMAIAARLDMNARTSPTQSIVWISDYTKYRSLVQEIVSYFVFIVKKNGI